MSAFVIVNVNQTTFYCIMTCICILSSMFFLLLKKPRPVATGSTHEKAHEPSDFDKKLESPTEARISQAVQESSDNKIGKELKETWQLLISLRMLKVIPLIVWSALSLSIFAAIFAPLLTATMFQWADDTSKQSQSVLLALVFLGLGEIIGGLAIGRI